ncbi:type II secretion system protein [Candidatus Woesebacteria bacterium]|nr:type II secretion system protein [Candidatus Woesebacteria bacterium]
MRKYARQAGFTLIELLVVIGILAVLLAIVLIAINPARQFAQANNTQRASDVNAILNGVHQFMADNNGTTPTALTASGSGTISDTEIDICGDLVPVYLAALPADPQTGDPVDEAGCAGAYETNYTITRSATNNRITVTAPGAELGQVISVTR